MDSTRLNSQSNRSETEQHHSLVCEKCQTRFLNLHELLKHKEGKRHFACHDCENCFRCEQALRQHRKREHRPDQILECPGCHIQFNAASAFWRHFESDNCTVICYSDVAKLRNKKLEFAEQLERRKVPFDDTISERVGVGCNVSTPVPFVRTNSANHLHYRIQDFPKLPPIVDHRAGETKDSTPWSYDAAPPPACHRIVPTSVGQSTSQDYDGSIRHIRAFRPFANSSQFGPHDATSRAPIIGPNHRHYDEAEVYNRILKMYVCPYKACMRKFVNAAALSSHLQSAAHAGGRYNCIGCNKFFTTVWSMISHMEMATHCSVRDCDDVRCALGQLTGGILDFNTRTGTFFVDENSVRELLTLRPELYAAPEQSKMELAQSGAEANEIDWNNEDSWW